MKTSLCDAREGGILREEHLHVTRANEYVPTRATAINDGSSRMRCRSPRTGHFEQQSPRTAAPGAAAVRGGLGSGWLAEPRSRSMVGSARWPTPSVRPPIARLAHVPATPPPQRHHQQPGLGLRVPVPATDEIPDKTGQCANTQPSSPSGPVGGIVNLGIRAAGSPRTVYV